MSQAPSLAGRTIALLEARRATELAALVASYGGTARHAPALREEPVDDLPAIAAFLDDVAADGLDVVVFQTGVGARAVQRGVEALGRADEWLAALDRAIVVVRGPKPTAVLRELNVRIDRRAPEPHTTAEVLAALADLDLAEQRVAVQQYGETNHDLTAALAARGAHVREVEVYRWALPEDISGLESLVRDLPFGGVDAVVVTSQVQVRHLFEVAARLNTTPDLAGTTVAAVGPVAARELARHGVHVDVQPGHPKMGALVRELATYLEAKR